MAQKTVVQIVDDLDGTDLEQDDVDQVRFALDGMSYVIDLSKANAFLLRSTIERYVDVARRDQPLARATRSTHAASVARRTDLDQIRQWARENGHPVSARGRVPNAVLDAYDHRG